MATTPRSVIERVVAMLRHNGRKVTIDILLLVAWLLLGTELLRTVAVPRWLQYIVLFGGVIVYAQLTAPWEHPPIEED